MDKWEIKQIVDCVSKGVNSVLMNAQKRETKKKLEELALDLTEIYIKVLKRLKQEPDWIPEDARDDLPVIEEDNEPVEFEDLVIAPEKKEEFKKKFEELKEKVNATKQ